MPSPPSTILELEAIPPQALYSLGDRLVGSWSGGRHFVSVEEELISTHIWFHFDRSGTVTISLRHEDEEQPRVARGCWSLRGERLAVTIGQSRVESALAFNRNVMAWAGELLVRVSVRPLQPGRA